MNKSKLTKAMAERAKSSEKSMHECLNAIMEIITKALKKGESVALIGFGKFKAIDRQAKLGRNPKTGVTIKIPAIKVAKFTPSKILKELVNKKNVKKK